MWQSHHERTPPFLYRLALFEPSFSPAHFQGAVSGGLCVSTQQKPFSGWRCLVWPLEEIWWCGKRSLVQGDHPALSPGLIEMLPNIPQASQIQVSKLIQVFSRNHTQVTPITLLLTLKGSFYMGWDQFCSKCHRKARKQHTSPLAVFAHRPTFTELA